jgi:hypothetical protein
MAGETKDNSVWWIVLAVLVFAPLTSGQMTFDKKDGAQLGWTIETAMSYLANLIEERDRRYDQRFTSLEAAEKTDISGVKAETAIALSASKEETALALTASKEAVTKAEVASEKRFESVNEFRATLANQQSTLVGKNEFDEFKHASDKQSEDIKKDISLLASKLDVIQGHASGSEDWWKYFVGAVGVLVLVVPFVSRAVVKPMPPKR